MVLNINLNSYNTLILKKFWLDIQYHVINITLKLFTYRDLGQLVNDI